MTYPNPQETQRTNDMLLEIMPYITQTNMNMNDEKAESAYLGAYYSSFNGLMLLYKLLSRLSLLSLLLLCVAVAADVMLCSLL